MVGIGKEDVVVIGGDLNGHVGEKADGYKEVHGGSGVGIRNKEGERILEFCNAVELKVLNTWMDNEEDKRVTYESGGVKSMIDYLLGRGEAKTELHGLDVVYVGMQHRLVVGDFRWKSVVEDGGKSKIRRQRLRTWRLKEENVQKAFVRELRRMEEKEGRKGGGSSDVNGKWKKMKRAFVKATEVICGRTKGKVRNTKMVGWSENAKKAWREKLRWEQVYHEVRTEEAKIKYSRASKVARREARKGFNKRMRELAKDLESEEGKRKVFKLARRWAEEGQDIRGVKGIRQRGEIVTEKEQMKKVWKEYFEKLLNEENEWDRSTECEVKVERGKIEWGKIEAEEVVGALRKMKEGKAAGPSEVVAEMIRAAEELGVEWMTDLCNTIIVEERIPEDWKRSILIPVYKGKGDPMECGSYRAIKLLEHAMKVVERVLERRIRKIVKVDDMQFGFTEGKGTIDAIFMVRQLQERYRGKGKKLYYAFVDLEKAYDRVPRAVTKWAMRKLGVAEWLVKTVMAMYEQASTVVRTEGGDSESFEVKVGLHQGSVLSPLLFLIVMEAVTREVRGGLPWELLYADDLVLVAKSWEELKGKLKEWKMAMERKGLKVNMGKTKVLGVREGVKGREEGEYPCAVCRKGVGCNAIMCGECESWVHKKCSGIKGKLPKVAKGFRCRRCREGKSGSEEVGEGDGLYGSEEERDEMGMGEGLKVEVVRQFCYLGDVIEAEGGIEGAVAARISYGWRKFRLLKEILTMRRLSLKLRGKLYVACVRSVILYGSETWAVKVDQVRKLERVEMRMVRWMYGVSLKERRSSEDLRAGMGIEGILMVLRRNRLRWFGHVERKEDENWVKKCRTLEVEGKRRRGRPEKTWDEVVKEDMTAWGLSREMAQDRGRWREALKRRGVDSP